MDPVTVITCIQVASSVAGMLSQKGPDIGDLLKIQTEMLKNISHQITKLQDGINQIIQDIDELKKFVEYQLPTEVYKTFATKDLLSEFSGYDSIIYAFFYDRQEVGILKAYEDNKTDLLNQLNSIQKIRNKLLLYNEYFLAPIIARCFKIEMDLLIILYKDVYKGKFLASFLNYENWLSEMQNEKNNFSVDYFINCHKQNIEIANQNSYGFRMCKLEESKKRDDMPCKLGYSEKYHLKFNVEFFNFKRVFNTEFEKQMIESNCSYDDLLNIYNSLNIDLKYLPAQISQTVSDKYKDEVLDLNFTDEFYNEIKADGQKAYQTIEGYKDDRFDVERSFLFAQNTCDAPSQQIFTNKKYFNFSNTIELNSKQIVVPITHKKIMFDIQNKINFLKSKI